MKKSVLLPPHRHRNDDVGGGVFLKPQMSNKLMEEAFVRTANLFNDSMVQRDNELNLRALGMREEEVEAARKESLDTMEKGIVELGQAGADGDGHHARLLRKRISEMMEGWIGAATSRVRRPSYTSDDFWVNRGAVEWGPADAAEVEKRLASIKRVEYYVNPLDRPLGASMLKNGGLEPYQQLVPGTGPDFDESETNPRSAETGQLHYRYGLDDVATNRRSTGGGAKRTRRSSTRKRRRGPVRRRTARKKTRQRKPKRTLSKRKKSRGTRRRN